MGFGNSNNWQTEAVLRNERLAKQTSLDKLLEHVNWDAETLTLSLSGITLSWGDIEGSDDVAMKSDIANVVRYTEIGTNYVITENLTATNLAITGDSTFDGTVYVSQLNGGNTGNGLYLYFDNSEKNGGYDPNTGLHYSGAKFYVGFGDSPWDAESTGLSVSDGSISLRAESQIWIGCDNGVFLYGDVQVNDKKVATLNDIPTNLVYRNNNGFSQCTGDPSSMVCILNGELRYITKSTIKSWLGIS